MIDVDQIKTTRERLLETAGEVFAAKGFNGATVRDICSKARANVAAINYHFGDKEQLYAEVLKFAAQFSVEKYPLAGGLTETSTPAEKLRGFIRNYIERLLDEARPAWHGQLLAREMIEPTPAMDDLVTQYFRPQHDRIGLVVSDLLGPAFTKEDVRYTTNSMIAECVFYKHCRPIITKLTPEQGYAAPDRAKLAEYISAFMLAAIAELRRNRVGAN